MVCKMPKIERFKKRHLLKTRDWKTLLERITHELGPVTQLDERRLEAAVLDDGSRVYLLDGTIVFFEDEERIIPSVQALLDGILTLPSVTVDMGAIKHVINGADVMRPGVTRVDDGIVAGAVVSIVDERHGRPIAVGISLMSSDEMRHASSGKVILNRHHVGDPLWEFGRSENS